jgi:hypothetical protein|tara:strand:+ start:309 stop:710 length:402 start_codon:yes stop_codon:yes gene_type:complete
MFDIDFSILNDKNYMMYAMRNYDNPQCTGIDEFNEDISKIKYIKRLFKRYTTTGELKERLILNHIIVFYNVFGIVPATRLLFYRIESCDYELLKTFLVFLNICPEDEKEKEIPEVDLISVSLNKDLIKILRKL